MQKKQLVNYPLKGAKQHKRMKPITPKSFKPIEIICKIKDFNGTRRISGVVNSLNVL
jgi:hypothetical protein